MYKVRKSVLRKVWVCLSLLVFLTSCGAPNIDKSFEFDWEDGGKTICTPIYNEDGSFAQSSCRTYCNQSPNGFWAPDQESKGDGKFIEVFLPVENETQFLDLVGKKGDRNAAFLALCSTRVQLDNGLSCLRNVSENGVVLLQYCTFTCADGEIVNVQLGTKENGYTNFINGDFRDFSIFPRASFEDDFCSAPAASAAATDTPTEEAPTEAPTEEPPAELPTPILTGDVTYCDIVSRSVNLRLVEGFAAEDFSHEVTIGGEAMSCKVNEGNASLLTCTFPSTTKFPASIQVSKDGNVVNEFEFNGSNCVVPQIDKDDDREPRVVCDPVILAMDFVCVPLP